MLPTHVYLTANPPRIVTKEINHHAESILCIQQPDLDRLWVDCNVPNNIVHLYQPVGTLNATELSV